MPKISINNEEYEVAEGSVIYDALYDLGLELPHGCLSGSCGACRIEVIEGVEELEAPGFVEQDTINSLKKELATDAHLRLACRAKVKGNIKIKPFK